MFGMKKLVLKNNKFDMILIKISYYNKMAAGQFNGHNHGGMHTGLGNFRKGGPYALNGYRRKIYPHKMYKEGHQVIYNGSRRGYEGKGIIMKKNRTSEGGRSFIKVKMGEKVQYFHKDQLWFVEA